jgi:hypothetical protein
MLVTLTIVPLRRAIIGGASSDMVSDFRQRRASRSSSIFRRIARDRGRAGPPSHHGFAERSR